MIKKTEPEWRILPDPPELHKLLMQALEQRGKSQQITWRINIATQLTVEVIYPLKGGDPNWSLYVEKPRKREKILEYASCEILLIHNLISAASNDIQKTGRVQTKVGLTPAQRKGSDSVA